MAYIKVTVEFPIKDGTDFAFHAPCDCSSVDGITVIHPHGQQNFVFADAHGNTLTGINNLFVRGSLIQAILDVTNSVAFLPNADTNGYLERIVGVERTRIDELVAMRRSAPEEDYTIPLNGGHVRGIIRTNGTSATATFAFESMNADTFGDDGVYETDYIIPPQFKGLDASVPLVFDSATSLSAVIDFKNANSAGWHKLVVYRGVDDAGAVEKATVTYPLSTIGISELTDIRVSSDGETVYPTAGDAVRAAQQTAEAARQTAEGAVDLANDFSGDIATLYNEVADLKENGKVVVDDALSVTSTNPVQNRVVTQEIQRVDGGLQTVNLKAQNALNQSGEALNAANEAGSIAQTAREKLERNVIPRVEELEKNGTGGGESYTIHETEDHSVALSDESGNVVATVKPNGEIDGNFPDKVARAKLKSFVDTDKYAVAFCDEQGYVAYGTLPNGEKVGFGGGGAPAVTFKQNGNYDSEINMFICYGQSWSTGYDASAITTAPRYDNLMLDTGIMNNPLDDLTAVATSFVPAVERTGTSSASSGAIVGETPVTAQMHTVKQLMESEDGLTVNDLSYQLLGTAPGMGNMSLAQLAKGTDYYARLINQVQQAHNIATAMGKRLVVQAFSWVQWGLGSGLTGTYAENLERLRADIDADVKAITGQKQDVKCITWQAYFYANTLNAKQVYDQFVGAAETYPNIICAGAAYHLSRVTASNAHFKSESQDWLGAYFGVAYKRTIIDGEGFEPLKPTKASKAGKILYVKFNVPQRPLVFDTESLSEVPNKGFKLYATDGVEKTITDVAIISPDTVKIVCADDVLSTDRLTYCENTSTVTAEMRATHGNLRDSQGDHIQYESGAGTTLPLHNWCVIFDKTITELEV